MSLRLQNRRLHEAAKARLCERDAGQISGGPRLYEHPDATDILLDRSDGRDLDWNADLLALQGRHSRTEVLCGQICRKQGSELRSKDEGSALKEGRILHCQLMISGIAGQHPSQISQHT